jgi:hypothetical protein
MVANGLLSILGGGSVQLTRFERARSSFTPRACPSGRFA